MSDFYYSVKLTVYNNLFDDPTFIKSRFYSLDALVNYINSIERRSGYTYWLDVYLVKDVVSAVADDFERFFVLDDQTGSLEEVLLSYAKC